ncbi:hypothetical protein [Maribacter sp. 2307ULW6-5]|uniref:hypothetical protein n=1 Tax=Maribacter sp. 2307ULW6-5 TaxID=3386275 RepID=UPI0039BD58E4
MKATRLFFLSALVLLSSCGGLKNMMASEWTKENYNGKEFDKLTVLVVSKDMEVRQEAEEAIVAQLVNQGQDAITGMNIVSLVAGESEWQEEQLVKRLKEQEVDGVLVLSLVNVRDKQVYNPGTAMTYPTGFARAGGFIFRTYGYVQTPDYYTTEKEYIIEANLYDTGVQRREEALVWSGQSAVSNYASIKGTAKSYGKQLARYLTEKGIVQ